MRLRILLIVLSLSLSTPTITWATTSTTIVVIDAETRAPVGTAMIRLVSTGRSYLSRRDGRLTLKLSRTSTQQIVITAPGYQRLTMTRVSAALLGSGSLTAEMAKVSAHVSERVRLIGEGRLYYESLYSVKQQALVVPTIEVPTTVRVKKSATGEIIELPLEEYIRGVLPKEIGTSAPLEAIKAQAVAARSYAINYLKSHDSICDTAACQVWGPNHYEKTDQAVLETAGQVAIYNGKIINAVFSAQCGGHTISGNEPQSSKCGGWSSTPYLKGVPCWENRGDSCGPVCSVTKFKDGYQCHDPAKPGSNDDPDLCYDIWGHQRGLCQRGAMSMARCGKDYIEIVKHYYQGVEIANAPPAEEDANTLTQSELPGESQVAPGSHLLVSWTFKNTGNTAWNRDRGYNFAFVEGQSFGKPGYFQFESDETVDPEGEITWAIELTAPEQPGIYTGSWQMRHGGVAFGEKVSVTITVVAPVTSNPPDTGNPPVGNGDSTPLSNPQSPVTTGPVVAPPAGPAPSSGCQFGDRRDTTLPIAILLLGTLLLWYRRRAALS